MDLFMRAAFAALIAIAVLAAPAAALTVTAARNVPYRPQRPARRPLAPLRGGGGSDESMDFVLKTLAPLMGGIISATMFVAPFPAVLKARASKALGDLNLSPYPAQCGNCAAWLSYGLLISNRWVMAPNVVGLITGLFFTYTGYALGSVTQRDAILVSFASYMSVIGVALLCALNGVFSVSAKDVMGRVSIGLLMIYYCSPLSTIAKVLQTKDSSSIDGALTVVGIVNGLFWAAYGLAISDIYVYGPNLTGAALSTCTTLVWLLYRSK